MSHLLSNPWLFIQRSAQLKSQPNFQSILSPPKEAILLSPVTLGHSSFSLLFWIIINLPSFYTFPFWTFHVRGLMRYVVLCDWPRPLSPFPDFIIHWWVLYFPWSLVSWYRIIPLCLAKDQCFSKRLRPSLIFLLLFSLRWLSRVVILDLEG